MLHAGATRWRTSVGLDLTEHEVFSETELGRRHLDNLVDGGVHSHLETDVRVVGAVDPHHRCTSHNIFTSKDDNVAEN